GPRPLRGIMFDLLRARWRQGTRTLPFPAGRPELPERFRGLPVVDAASAGEPRTLPSALVTSGEDGRPALDVGACLFSPEEAGRSPAGTIAYSQDYRLASSTRQGLVSPGGGEVELAHALDERMRRLFGRSLRLRSVVAGSCGGCEAELQALGNATFDLARFGVQFVASPRHADGIVITGAVNRAMREALELTWEATPAPRIVIAVGACAISGGPFRGSPEVAGGVPPGLPVDLYVPGCPPHPLTLLDGLLRLLGRLDGGGLSRSSRSSGGPGTSSPPR
ncbi:MAG TPA: hypothetical protein VE075_02830, partial [Thermoanaerobaculia bacterium]|nr:hypothetical protein [Thermoanaerobaculia bacterium]